MPKGRMPQISCWLMLALLTIVVFPFSIRGSTGCGAALENIGGAIELYQIAMGKHPSNLADLYKEGFVERLSEFLCPGTDETIASVDELEQKADFKLLYGNKDDHKTPLVAMKVQQGAAGRAYLPGGILVPYGSSVSRPGEPERNNQRETASALPVGKRIKGNISSRDEVDVYWLPIAHQGTLGVKIGPVSKELEMELRVLDSEGQVVQRYERPRSGAVTEALVDLKTRGTYYLELSARGNDVHSPEPYELELTFAGTTDDEEPNDNLDTASPIAVGETIEANILPRKDVDLYGVRVDKAGTLEVDISSAAPELDIALRVMDVTGEVVRSHVRPEKPGAPTRVTVDLPAPGTYYLELHDRGGGRSSKPYLLKTSFSSAG